MISEQKVQYIAKLARLELNQDEIKRFQKEFSLILDYFKLLEKIDTSKITPTFYSIPLKNVLREDKAEPKNKQDIDKILEQIPAKEKRYVRVKAVL